MTAYVRWLFPIVCFAIGSYLLHLSFRAYAKWRQALADSDMSLVEAYEMEFWPEVSVGLLLILLAAFLAGRWSMRGL